MLRPALLTFALLPGCDRVWGLQREIDAPLPIDAPPDLAADAANCYGTGLVTLCLVETPAGNFDVPNGGAFLLDTDSATICKEYTGEPGYCVLAAQTMTINSTLRGRGKKPLVLVASDSITIAATGAIDVSSDSVGGAGSEPVTCPGGLGGAMPNGGGAGGSFGGIGGRGGAGGLGGAGGTPAQPQTITTFRGGCHGGNGANIGASGLGGGAVYVIAGSTIVIDGAIDASGNGGRGGAGSMTLPGGGGGGGSGGMIGLDAPSIVVAGSVFANGGAGGEGGGQPATGEAGAKPTLALVPAEGGTAGTVPGGEGGDGAAGPTVAGTNGKPAVSTPGGGGGAGGGAGIIRVYPLRSIGVNVSPAPS